MSLDVQQISLDISKQPTPQQVRLGQGDANATQLVVSVFDDGIAYSLNSYSVRLEMRLPNSDTYYSVDGTRSGNVATFDIDETYAATSYGFDGFGYVDILSGDTVICSTSRFQLVVLQNAQEGADPSTAYSNGIAEATERANDAAEAAEGVVLQAVPLMSATIRGGAQLGTGLEITDGVLSVDSSVFDLPTMSATTKGGAKLGAGLSVADDMLTLSGESYTSAEKSKLAGIEANANNYTLPTMGASTKGGAKLGSGLSVANDTLSLNLPTMSASTKGGAKLGEGLTVEDETLSLSGESFTAAEKTKLAGIEDNANNYSLPTMSASTKGGAKLGAGLSVSNDALSVNLTVETFKKSYSVAASSGSGAVDIDISKTGYTPLGIVGAASGSQSVALVQFSLFDATARCYFRNVSSSEYSLTCNVRVLYIAQ